MSDSTFRVSPGILLTGNGVSQSVIDALASMLAELKVSVAILKIENPEEFERHIPEIIAAGWRILIVLRGEVTMPETDPAEGTRARYIQASVFELFERPRVLRVFRVEAGRPTWVEQEAGFVLLAMQVIDLFNSDEGLRAFVTNLGRWLIDERTHHDVGGPLVRDTASLVSAEFSSAEIKLKIVKSMSPMLWGFHHFIGRLAPDHLMNDRRIVLTALEGPVETGQVALADPKKDPVVASVYAPTNSSPGDTVMVQVFAHLPGQEGKVASLALLSDDDAMWRAAKKLFDKVPRGARLGFHLSVPRARVDEPYQEIIWQGIPDSVQFAATFPKRSKPGTLVGTVTMNRDGVPVGHVKFKLELAARQKSARGANKNVRRRDGEWTAYREAFLSYASRDRPEVMKRAQMLSAARLHFFLDILSFNPGDRWKKGLYKHIDSCDVFFLFWSRAAKNSKWVREEAKYAHGRQGGRDDAPPAIIPIPLEGPPPVKPPPELNFLHFNDKYLYLLKGVEAEVKTRREGKHRK